MYGLYIYKYNNYKDDHVIYEILCSDFKIFYVGKTAERQKVAIRTYLFRIFQYVTEENQNHEFWLFTNFYPVKTTINTVLVNNLQNRPPPPSKRAALIFFYSNSWEMFWNEWKTKKKLCYDRFCLQFSYVFFSFFLVQRK